jgi:hypothetical protein
MIGVGKEIDEPGILISPRDRHFSAANRALPNRGGRCWVQCGAHRKQICFGPKSFCANVRDEQSMLGGR